MPTVLDLFGGRIYLDDVDSVVDLLNGLNCEVTVHVGKFVATSADDLRDATDSELGRVRLVAVREEIATLVELPNGQWDFVEEEPTGATEDTFTVDFGNGTVEAHTLSARPQLEEIAEHVDERSRHWGRANAARIRAAGLLLMGLTTGGVAALTLTSDTVQVFQIAPTFVLTFLVPLVCGAMFLYRPRRGRPVHIEPLLRREGRQHSRDAKRELVAGITGAVVGAAITAVISLLG
ncbi:hypothetical protein GCM10009633_23870 [Janibacter melonis]